MKSHSVHLGSDRGIWAVKKEGDSVVEIEIGGVSYRAEVEALNETGREFRGLQRNQRRSGMSGWVLARRVESLTLK